MTLTIRHRLFACFLCCLLCAGASLTSCGVNSVEDCGLLEYCDESTKTMLHNQQTPILLRYYCLRETSEEYEVTDTAVINAVLQAILDIRIISETDIFATDYDDIFVFAMEDGTEYSFSFNRHCFQSNGKMYELSDDEELWKLAERISAEG